MARIVQVSDVREFLAEIPPAGPERPLWIVRVSANERVLQTDTGWRGRVAGIEIQTVNAQAEIVWLRYSQPFYEGGEPGVEHFLDLAELCRDYFRSLGFDVRDGRYVTPEDVTLLNGDISDIAAWDVELRQFAAQTLPVPF